MLELTVPVGVADHVLGPPRAPVTVVEYGDFECPNCKQAAAAVKIMLARFAGRVRFAYRHFPLEGEHPRAHPHALQAALAAEAAGAQGKFWAMHDLLFENQRQLELPQLRRYAQHLDLDLVRYDAAMADERCRGACASTSRAPSAARCAARRASSSTAWPRTSPSGWSTSWKAWKLRSQSQQFVCNRIRRARHSGEALQA